MIGDSPTADIAGAQNAGISSVWLRRGRDWPIGPPAPDHQTDTFSAAVHLILDAG